jgi:hypothetical protein
MAKQAAEAIKRDKVIIFGNPNYWYDQDNKVWELVGNDKTPTCEIYDVEDIKADRILTYRHTLPLADANIVSGSEGMYYCYNASLPYLTETAHLAEVEKNIIIGQAYLYKGRTAAPKNANLMMFVVMGAMFLLAMVGMFK